MINFLHTNVPNAILFSFGEVGIHWYGFLMTSAFVLAFLLARKLWLQQYKEDSSLSKTEWLDHLYNISFYLVVFGLLGARLYHVLNEFSYYSENPAEILSIWNGGLAIHGALIAGALTVYVYLKKHMVSLGNPRSMVLKVADVFAPGIALGQAIGRWGNYFNQELYGIPTNAAWGIPIQELHRRPGFTESEYFHPTFLYESILNLIVFGILMFLTKSKIINQKCNIPPGTIAAVYLILYSLIRMSLEFIRIDATLIIFGIRLPILVSIVLILGTVAFFYKQKKVKT